MTDRTLTDTATITQDVTTAGQVKLNIPASVALTTPNIGAATATSVNKLTITAPATSATLTIADGKTLTCSRTITLNALSDGQTINLGNVAGVNSFALGSSSYVGGDYSLSLGYFAEAAGSYSVNVGYSALADATNCTAVGASAHSSVAAATALGSNSRALAASSTAVGDTTVADAASSTALGAGADVRGVIRHARATYVSKVQRYEHMLYVQTTDATPAVLRSNNSAAGTTNQNTLSDNSAQSFRGRVIGFTSDSAAACGFEFSGLIRRTANAASTALVSAVTPVAIGTPDAALATATVAVTADTTNGALAVTVTGVAATTINWTCVIDSELRAT